LNSPEQLLDVIVGSTSIFPIFPSRELARRDYTIVDGGFAHNIPVEAAARWGASQILVVEASPADEGAQRGNAFVSNAKAAFDLLFAEAQQVDVSLRGTLPLSALRPTPAACGGPQSYTALDLFDFSPRLLSRAIDFGMSQAKCEQPTYDRVWLTTPNFVEVATRVK
jgi:predicted acylesterase/phospholipase RssA